MIQVSVEVIPEHIHQPKTFVTCPQCEKVDFFHNFISRVCEDCGFPWGNIISLMNDVRVRKYYFKRGEID